MWPGWRRDTKLSPGCMRDVTCLEVRYQCSYPVEVELYMDGGEIGIFGPGWKWASTWMEIRQKFWDLEAGEAGHGWRWSTHPETRMDGGEKLHWRSWCKNLDTWMQMRQGLDIGETHVFRSGWVWDWTWMELRCNSRDLDGTDTSPGWRWVANIRTWIEVRHGMNIDETWI